MNKNNKFLKHSRVKSILISQRVSDQLRTVQVIFNLSINDIFHYFTYYPFDVSRYGIHHENQSWSRMTQQRCQSRMGSDRKACVTSFFHNALSLRYLYWLNGQLVYLVPQRYYTFTNWQRKINFFFKKMLHAVTIQPFSSR